MEERYYLDTCIWRDHYENRFGKTGRPLGKYATKLIMKILSDKNVILFSEFTIRELRKDLTKEEINDMLNLLFISGTLKKVGISEEEYREARKISKEKGLPLGDVLHVIISRNNKAVLVSQDWHFKKLKNLVSVKAPEEIN